jgi:hypothetical protein
MLPLPIPKFPAGILNNLGYPLHQKISMQPTYESQGQSASIASLNFDLEALGCP